MTGSKPRLAQGAFTLVELLVSIVIFAMVISGVIYGYVQANRFAEWTSMSYAAQSYALQGLEQARGAQWMPNDSTPVDQIHAGTVYTYQTNDVMDVPVTGAPFYVTNVITVTAAPLAPGISTSVQLRQVMSQCIWTFPFTGRRFTNTVVTFRAPDRS